MQTLPTTSQLKMFVNYSKCSDIALAAASSDVTISEFNLQMKELELLLGTKLIIHRDRDSQLTKDGELFAEQATRILDDLTRSSAIFRDKYKDSTTISVGALLTMGDILMDQHVLYFESQYPQLKLQNINREASALLEALNAGEVDVIALFGLDKLDIDYSLYEYEPFFTEAMVYYAPNIEKIGSSITLEEMSQIPLVRYSPNFIMNRMISEYVEGSNVAFQTDAWFATPYSIINYCQQRVVGSILSERLLNQLGFYDGYYRIKYNFLIPYSLFYRKDNPKQEQIRILIDFLHQLYSDQKNLIR